MSTEERERLVLRMGRLVNGEKPMTAEETSEFDAIDAKLADDDAAAMRSSAGGYNTVAGARGGYTDAAPMGRNVALTRSQSFSDYVRENPDVDKGGPTDLDMDKCYRGMIFGNWNGAEPERRAMVEATNSAGGYDVPTATSAMMIDKLRNKLVLNPTVVPLHTLTTNLPAWVTDPPVVWLNGETTDLNPPGSDPALGLYTFVAKPVGALVLASEDVLADAAVSGGLASKIEESINAVLARELERVMLYGTGSSGVPTGVVNTSGTQVQTGATNGLQISWQTMSQMAQTVRAGNVEPDMFVTNAKAAGSVARQTASGSGVWLGPDPSIQNLPVNISNEVLSNKTKGTGSALSDVFCLDSTRILLGMRSQMSIQLDQRFRTARQIGFMAAYRVDVVATHAEAAYIYQADAITTQ
jgi:HK97 family phage major capsid protein